MKRKGRKPIFWLDAKERADKRWWPRATFLSSPDLDDRKRMLRTVQGISNKLAYRLIAMYDNAYRVECYLPCAVNALRRMGYRRVF